MNNPTISTFGAAPALTPDLTEAQRFLDLLDPTATSWTFQTFDDNADRKAKWLGRMFHGTLTQHASTLRDMQQDGAGVFVTINETDGKGREGHNIVRVRALFADLDGAPLAPVTAWKQPDIIVDSSEGENWHAYWRVQGVALARFKPLQQMISERFNADKSVNDLPRVLRLPGFYHQKIDQRKGLTGVPYMVRVIHQTTDASPHDEAEFLEGEFAWLDKPPTAIPLSQQATPAARFQIDTGSTRPRKTTSDYAEILRQARTDGEKHKGVRGLSSHLAGSGVKREMAEAIIREACPVWDDGVISLIDSAYRKFAPEHSEAANLIIGKHGRPVWCAENACTVIETAPAWQDVLAHDEFAGLTLLMKPIPGTPVPRASFTSRPLADTDITAAVRWFNRHGFPDATKNTTADAVYAVAAQSVISPVRHYLDALKWDGVARVDTWLTRYCGAEDGNFTRKAGAAWLISAVARALSPGCKADCALVLEARQGAGKSSALKVLTGEAWFYDGLHDLHSKDASAGLRGKWIIELPELSAMRRSDVEAVKAFLSRTEDRYRPAYGRAEVIEPRRCVFAGTTNRTDYLTDDTGGRRFWPVAVGKVNLDGLSRDRDQLWAEAVARYRAGDLWWLDRETEAEAAAVVATRAADDPWEADVLRVAAGLSEVSTRDVFQLLEVPLDRRTKADQMRITGILTRAGWINNGRFTSGPSKGLTRLAPPREWSG